jgi:Tetratricopeptide repeat
MDLQNLVSIVEQQLGNKDLKAAATSLKQLLKDHPNRPEVQIAAASFYKATGKPEQAEAIYRDILKSSTQTSLLANARKGLKEIEDASLRQHQDGIARAIAQVGGEDMGFLAIHPIAPERKLEAAKQLAQIFRIDTYTAKVQIPSRNLKVLRIGRLGEMHFYGKKLMAAGIPALWTSLQAIASIDVHTVSYFEVNPDTGEILAVCTDGSAVKHSDLATSQKISFNWNEVSQRVHGLLPTFGEIVTVDAKHQLARKEDILDLVHICDLHLPKQDCILRFHDDLYAFDRGMQPEVAKSLDHIAPSVRERWSSLIDWLTKSTPQAASKDDFNAFAEMFLAYPDFLKELEPKVDLFRTKESLWDNCFQLYSGMIFKCNL